jgi:hypothetical protein
VVEVVEVAVVLATASGELLPNSTCPGNGIVHLQHMGSILDRVAVDSAARAVTRRTGECCCCDMWLTVGPVDRAKNFGIL